MKVVRHFPIVQALVFGAASAALAGVGYVTWVYASAPVGGGILYGLAGVMGLLILTLRSTAIHFDPAGGSLVVISRLWWSPLSSRKDHNLALPAVLVCRQVVREATDENGFRNDLAGYKRYETLVEDDAGERIRLLLDSSPVVGARTAQRMAERLGLPFRRELDYLD